MSLYVQKFGGTSVGTLDRIQSVAKHIAASYRQGHKLVVVVSAMGQQTDELLEMALHISSHPPQREVDMLLTAGERISMSLLAIALNEHEVPTLSLTGSQSGILTDNTFGNARIRRILGDRIREALQLGKLVIVAGFQGMSEQEKEITTLGRGGSDLTAIALAHSLKADRCQIFKDVDGVCTADPRLVAKARVLTEMSWDTLSALTSFGSGIVHHRGVHLAKKYQIPLEIRSSFNFSTAGTLIGSHRKVEKAQVYALTHRQNLSWICIHACDFSGLAPVLNHLWTLGEHPLFIQQHGRASDQGLQLVLGSKALAGLESFCKKKWTQTRVEIFENNLACVSLIGDGFWLEPQLLESAHQTLALEPLLIDCKNNVINFLLKESDLEKSIQNLHQAFLEKP